MTARKGFDDRKKEVDAAFSDGTIIDLPSKKLLYHLNTLSEQTTDHAPTIQVNQTRSNVVMNILNSRNIKTINRTTHILTGVVAVLTLASITVSIFQYRNSRDTSQLFQDFIKHTQKTQAKKPNTENPIEENKKPKAKKVKSPAIKK